MRTDRGSVSSPFVGARVSVEYILNTYQNGSPFVSVYTGAGADFILEGSRNITLPQIEVALRFRFGGSSNKEPVIPIASSVIPHDPSVILNEAKNLKTNTDTSASPQYDNDTDSSVATLPQNDKAFVILNAPPVILSEAKNLKTDTNRDSSVATLPQNDSMRETEQQGVSPRPLLRRIAGQARNDKEVIALPQNGNGASPHNNKYPPSEQHRITNITILNIEKE
ncbi:hypothetical protein AGMMS50229_00560 [Campylobacterota bacterium]|nr:hypothetical protein AGMMS50229_00560 [Campylobacterota bacterium]